MTDVEREAQPERLYEWSDKEMVERQHRVIEGQGFSMAAMSRELAEARAEITLGYARITAQVEENGRLRAERDESIRQHQKTLESYRALVERAPPDADAMERAHAVVDPWVMGNMRTDPLLERIASALTDYGDQRAREARAAAIEEVKAICAARYAELKIQSIPPSSLSHSEAAREVTRLESALRGLADIPPPPEQKAAIGKQTQIQWRLDEMRGVRRIAGEVVP